MLCLHWVGQAARGQSGCPQHCPGRWDMESSWGHAAAGLGVKQQCAADPHGSLSLSVGLCWACLAWKASSRTGMWPGERDC